MEQTTTKIILSVSLLFTNPVYADCPQDVQVVKQGQQANCDGFLFSHNAEQQAEQYRSDADFYKSYSDKLNEKIKLESDENDVLQKRLNLYIQESSTLSKDQASRDSNETWIRLGYFVLGVLGTGLVVRNVRP